MNRRLTFHYNWDTLQDESVLDNAFVLIDAISQAISKGRFRNRCQFWCQFVWGSVRLAAQRCNAPDS